MRLLKLVGYLLPAMVVSLVGAYAFLLARCCRNSS